MTSERALDGEAAADLVHAAPPGVLAGGTRPSTPSLKENHDQRLLVPVARAVIMRCLVPRQPLPRQADMPERHHDRS
jgi:hypothetical protein